MWRAAHERSFQLSRGNAVGMARATLAIGSLSTLLLTDQRALFLTFLPHASATRCAGIAQVGMFCISERLTGGRAAASWVAVAVLIAVLSGLWKKTLAVPHFVVSWSISQNTVLVEGGDQINAALTMLLVPWLLASPMGNAYSRRRDYLAILQDNAFARWAAELIRVQVSLVYAIAALAKFGVPRWADGTALWYWLQVPTFGLPPALFGLVAPVLQHPSVMVTATYSVLALELSLVGAIWTKGTTSRRLLWAGVAFHVTIAVVLGLWSFGITMTGALLLCRALQRAPVFFLTSASGLQELPTHPKGSTS